MTLILSLRMETMKPIKLYEKNGEPNLKKLSWYKGYSIQDLADITGLYYSKVQRLLDKNDIGEMFFKDIITFSEALQYESIDAFLEDLIAADAKVRTQAMENFILKAIDEQKKFGYVMPSTRDKILTEAKLKKKYRAVGTNRKPGVFRDALIIGRPDELMDKEGVKAFFLQDGTRVYEVLHNQPQS